MGLIERDVPTGQVAGRCDPRFAGVLHAFLANFADRNEVGASVCIMIDGEPVVDLWGGARTAQGDPWEADTVSIVFSCTKGASALCAHMAAERGMLDLDAPVVRYWPEFGQAGKEAARVSMMLDHSAGVPALREALPKGSVYDYDEMCRRLAEQAPFWVPGTRNGYHAITAAWTVGEMVRRSTGRRLGRFFAEEVAGPLGLDFWIGLPEEVEGRVAPIIPYPEDDKTRNSRLAQAVRADPMGPTGRFLLNGGGFNPNSRDGHAAEIGSANGITNGRGLAGLYAPLANGGSWRGARLTAADTLTRMARVSVATHEDATLMIPTRFSLGFMKSMDNRALDNADDCSVILAEPAFGHVGAGGSLGFADPEARMSFGYTMSRMGSGILLNDRGQSLVDAAYRALGYGSNAGGAWAA
ncbi:serine hydrolase domain-containing protein [Chelatococcus reniformis]|uniref:Esterase n=1 Tax=Chelatococcus reniformis TaxID=1494448 RepID=A0A916U4D9_9HYPH|nr:serine hydrolase domain-containing protein [Chelatococcus reniformis]GGC60182.1 esterase [Chelatococcus reniformis]